MLRFLTAVAIQGGSLRGLGEALRLFDGGNAEVDSLRTATLTGIVTLTCQAFVQFPKVSPSSSERSSTFESIAADKGLIMTQVDPFENDYLSPGIVVDEWIKDIGGGMNFEHKEF